MTRIESYSQALDWLYQRNQFAIKLGLKSPRLLLEKLGNPEKDLTFLHVAGTNGKGSVCANLASLLSLTGYRRVGLYTSPHLVSFRERIRVDGEPVPAPWVAEWMNKAMPVLEALNPTYFECVTAMAFAWFREQGCDAVVLETGLGGRLDATNVVTPKITVITSISLDHTAILGDTLEAIQGEKLGIAKPGVPLVVDEPRLSLAKRAEEKARELNAPFFNLSGRLQTRPEGFELRGAHGDYFLPVDLREESHQIRNAALSLLAFEIFSGKALPDLPACLSTLRETKMAGRTQWLHADGLLPVLLDGAHNPAGVEALCAHLKNKVKGRPRFFFSVMRDKEFAALYRSLRALSDDIVFLDLTPQFPRAVKFEELRQSLTDAERNNLRASPLTWDCLEFLLRPDSGAAPSPDYAVFCGSLYLLGEIIPTLLPRYHGLEEFARLMASEK